MVRLDQWNNNTYEQTKHLPTLLFAGDLPGGGVRCECGFCKEEIDIRKEDEVCSSCGADLIFPRCDW